MDSGQVLNSDPRHIDHAAYVLRCVLALRKLKLSRLDGEEVAAFRPFLRFVDELDGSTGVCLRDLVGERTRVRVCLKDKLHGQLNLHLQRSPGGLPACHSLPL